MVAADAPIKLAHDQVHVWLARHEPQPDRRLVNRYRELLDVEELDRYERFRFDRDRWSFLVARALLRTVLSRYGTLAAAHWRFVRNGYGKPFVAADLPLAHLLRFNLSHASGMVALAVACGRDVGIDVEACDREMNTAIARRYFAPAEVAWLDAMPLGQRAESFTKLWTLKESYLKGTGSGLSSPLNSMEFRLEDNRIVATPLGGQPLHATRSFWLLRPTHRHVLALCAEDRGAAETLIAVRGCMPLMHESRLCVEIERSSRAQDDAAINGRKP